MKSDILRFQIKTTSDGHQRRHLLIDRSTLSSSLIAGLYESYLSASSFSAATIHKSLEHVAALLSWDQEKGNIATERLMHGQPLTEPQIRQFKQWLEKRTIADNLALNTSQQESINVILRGGAAFEDWSLRYALTRHGHHSRLIDVRTIQKEFWKDVQGNVPHQEFAEDFTGEERLEIEQYLRSLAFNGRSRGVSETLCMRLSPRGFDGSSVEPFCV